MLTQNMKYKYELLTFVHLHLEIMVTILLVLHCTVQDKFECAPQLSLESLFLLLGSQVAVVRDVAANIFIGLNTNLLLQRISEVSFYPPKQST